jgi:AraC-like DNA-binding protein
MTPSIATTHRAQGLVPARQLIADEGLDLQACLRGTGILSVDIDSEERGITLMQEVRFYRNLLAQSGDPTIGLRLGRRFPPQRYGIFGYALLSAATLRHALAITTQFGDYLTFTWLHLAVIVEGQATHFMCSDRVAIDEDVRAFFYDRDLMAAKTAFEELTGRPLPLDRVCLPHGGHGQRSSYAREFGCTPQFADPAGGSISFSTRHIDNPLPYNDTVVSKRLQHQCRLLVDRMGRNGGVTDEVRQLIVGRPGYFPAIDDVAGRLNCSVRTLRQRLTSEGTGFQKILDEVRCTLAQDYLEQTQLPLSEISTLLGFSDPGNFAHAFKKWTSLSPSDFRRQRQRGQAVDAYVTQ